MIAKSHRWQKTALALATTALIGLFTAQAWALSLGRITVKSALGEALHAEIEIADINADEAATLKAAVALPEAFRSAGLDYNPAMTSLKATLHKRADGRSYLQLSSPRTINEPFVDLILEASWATGRIVRDYTMLFDPPSLRVAAPAPETPAQVPIRPTSNGATVASATVAPAAPKQRSEAPAAPSAAPSGAGASGMARAATARQVNVKAGDTASKIANATKPASVSLDQMLVALLRSNPHAFAGDNVNRIKAGAVLRIPLQEQIASVPAPQATQIMVAQSRDFDDFRRKLAGNAPGASVAAADRKASGQLQATVEDKRAIATAPDKLTLSKGPIQNQAADDRLARSNSARDAASRAADISRNIGELNKLGAATGAVVPSSAASASALAPTVAATQAQTPATPPVPAASSGAQSAASAALAAPKAVAASAAKRPASAPATRPEPGLIDSLIETPLLPVSVIGLTALLAFFGFRRARKQRKAAADTLRQSQLQPDSFFAVSGGQRVDTSDNPPTGSSMVYSPSQLDAVDNVDPVAEADVYLAYGRHQQAEEILKDALQSNPERIAIHQKLLGIFAKRSDIKSFQRVATLAYDLTKGQGLEWERICEIGVNIDPSNPLYLPGGHPDKSKAVATPPLPTAGDTQSAASTQPAPIQTGASQADASTALDLDLDFSVDPNAGQSIAGVASTQPVSALPGRTGDLKPPPGANFVASGAAPLTPAPEVAPVAHLDMLKFDLGSVSLDLDAPQPDGNSKPASADDPMATKLALAEEFSAIGDDDGARALIEEVVAEASGEMKIRAQQALSKLR